MKPWSGFAPSQAMRENKKRAEPGAPGRRPSCSHPPPSKASLLLTIPWLRQRVRQHETGGKTKGHGGDRTLKTCFGIDHIKTGGTSEVGRIQFAVPGESEPHHGVTSHQINDLRGCAGFRIDAI